MIRAETCSGGRSPEGGDDRADLLRVAVEVLGAHRRAGLLPGDDLGDRRVLAEQLGPNPTGPSSPTTPAPPRSRARGCVRSWKNVRILKGGLGSWTNAGLPVETKGHLPSIGLEIYKNLTLGDVERRRFKAGDVIFREGADARGEAYVVHDGSVEICKQIDGEHRVLRRHGEGDLFGELAFFREGPRSTDAIAASDVELLVIPTERLDWLIHNRPALTKAILRRLAEWVVMSDRERGTAEGW